MKNPIDGMDIAAQVKALGGAGRGGGTRKLAEARAAASGKSVRTEMRAVQRAMKSGKPPAKQAPRVARAGARKAAAAGLRAARRINAGHVKVSYPTRAGARAEGVRDLGGFDVTGDLAAAVEQAADLLDAGDARGAQDLLSTALLDEYGDLGGTLEIDDFIDGLRLE
ncbi:MAG: hypothetical protein ACJ768_24550 [Gaiellaceae bacterium]